MSVSKPRNAIFVGFGLALVWEAMTGDFQIGNFMFGWVLGSLLWLTLPPKPAPPKSLASYNPRPTNPVKWIRFALYFVWTILAANREMSVAVLRSIRSYDHLKPAIVEIPLNVRRASEITLLANWITLTPGTLTLDVTPEGDRLFVHTYHVGESAEAFVQEIKKFEKHVEDLFV